MTKRWFSPWIMWIAMTACAASDPTGADTGGDTAGGSGSADDGGGDDTTATSGPAMQWPPGETGGLGEACRWHDECVTWYCRRFADSPADPEAACAETPPWGTMIITGTIRDLVTGEPVGDVGVRVVSAVAAAANPMTADALAEATADASGRFETSSTLVNGTPLGIVAAVDADGYYLTATALAGPIDDTTDYYPGNDIHDMWVVPQADLAAWSELLTSDPLLSDFLPLGEKGGTIGLVRDDETGAPIVGAVVESKDGSSSSAYIRYLDDAGDGFVTEATGASGLFVLVNPALAEEFTASMGDSQIGSAVAGTADQSVLAITIQ